MLSFMFFVLHSKINVVISFVFIFSGTGWTQEGCRIGHQNKTHVICQCWPYGIVTVLGKGAVYYVRTNQYFDNMIISLYDVQYIYIYTILP